MADRRRPTLTVVVGVLLGAMLLVALLLTPASDDSRGLLTSTSTAPGGARALHDLQLRSGWQVERMDAPYADSMDRRAVYAVLDPLIPLTAREVHRLLEAVRGGASLFVVISDRGSLSDSLGIGRSSTGAVVSRADEAPDGFCADSLNRPGLINWPGGRVQSYWLTTSLKPAMIFTHLEPETRLPRRAGGVVASGDTVRPGREQRNTGDSGAVGAARRTSSDTVRLGSAEVTGVGTVRPGAAGVTTVDTALPGSARRITGDTVSTVAGRRTIVDSVLLSSARVFSADTVLPASARPAFIDSMIMSMERDSTGGTDSAEREYMIVRTRVETTTVRLPRLAMAGYTLGRGRVVAVADADLLRNDVLRVCRWNAGPNAARALHWLAVTAGERLVFDEFHQDATADANPVRAMRRALVLQPWGRMVFVAALGGLVLLTAAGMRPISPAPLTTAQRRSPLEHVRALARAYESAGSTRLVARRLVRGLRRRHALASLAGGDDNAFLTALAERHPATAADVDLLRSAMAEPVPAAQLPSLGDAVARIDSRLRPNI